MQYTLFGAIDIGSSEMELKIFELSRGKGMREIDCIRNRLELGKDTYATGKISTEKLEELCLVLNDFISIMKSYKVEAYRAYTTSAIREAKNRVILLDYLEKKTGLKIEVLDNAEQRFLDYKSIAAQANEFNRIIEKGTAILDVGGGSVQVSLFDKDSLVSTQNIRIGNLRIRERVAAMEHIRKAMDLCPGNEEYRQLYQIIQSGSRMYTNTGSRYGFQTGGTFCNPICLSWCLLNACCGGNGLYFCC